MSLRMWLMKNSVKIVKLFLFLPPRKVHCFTETMGKEEGKKRKGQDCEVSHDRGRVRLHSTLVFVPRVIASSKHHAWLMNEKQSVVTGRAKGSKKSVFYNLDPWYAEKDAGSFKKTSKSVTDGIAGSRKNKAGILLQGKIKKRREAFGAMSFS